MHKRFRNSAQYADAEEMAKLDIDVDISKYIAGGIVVFDLKTRQIKWRVDIFNNKYIILFVFFNFFLYI